MSCSVLQSNVVASVSIDKYHPEQTVENQNEWVRGATQGALFKIHEEIQGETAQKLIDNIDAASRKTSQWLEEALHTRTDINKISQKLFWTLNDITEVAGQSNQLSLVNLQRAHTMLQTHCCQIIRKVSTKLIKNTLAVAKRRVDHSDPFQLHQLDVIASLILDVYKNSKVQAHADIAYEEAKSLWMRQEFQKQIGYLLSDPSRYHTVVIKETAKICIESTYDEVREISNLSDTLLVSIQLVRNQAMDALNVLEMTTPDEMLKECETIVKQVTRVGEDILLAYKAHWNPGKCGRVAA